jgi:hypothetical protein
MMKKRTQSEIPPLPEDDLHPPDDLGLPAEAPLRPEEAAEAVGGTRRLLEPVAPAVSDEKEVGPAPPAAPLPWPPMRPDETPS